ncbi:hypothetical protein CLV82_2634 [Zeaxanthinibacter enoshimensis]|uniref:Uncharacterized protein n=1 Tax=Zeaxanthinibacter enoshimensis TaxID=392009 RepID=A0A4R6TIT5_9FLAO|nr:hypothetical protein CLV82_2634 [Zeaxanthinibacter enoshimensis]
MVTFFAIFSCLVVFNVALLVHSSLYARTRSPRPAKSTDRPEIKIYPLDLLASSYKKAI